MSERIVDTNGAPILSRKAASRSQPRAIYTAGEAERPPVRLLIGGDSGKIGAATSQF